MVENSRDPNMSTKIQELSRQVSFIILISQECYFLKCIWFTKVPESASPFQDWNRMSSQSKQVIISLICLMNDYHLGALSTSSSTTSGAKYPRARNCFKKLPFYIGSVTEGLQNQLPLFRAWRPRAPNRSQHTRYREIPRGQADVQSHLWTSHWYRL